MTDSKAPTLESQPLNESAPPEQMADTYADRLMDELFDGVERALEGDVEALDAKPQPDVVEPPAVSELTLSFTEGGLPAVLLDRGTAAPLDASGTNDLAAIADEIAPTTPIPESPQKPKSRLGSLNKVLLGIAGLTAVAAFGLWLQQRQQAVPLAATSSAPAEVPVVDTNAEFLEYLRRSLDVIAQNAPAATPDAAASVSDVAISLNNGVGLPPIGNNVLPGQLPGGMPSAPGSINVIERVYVPYPSTQTAVNPQPAPGNVAAATGNAAPNPTANAAPAIVHTLVGVLELGDRSAALFEVDGTTQRVYIGERIGSSGWSLVSVANEEAIVRRNGEVRTLYIGQRF